MSKTYNVAVIGATGNTGRSTLETLAERNFPINEAVAIASERSRGREVSFGDKSLRVRTFSEVDFSEIDIAIFCAGANVSSRYAPIVTESGCTVIDKTSYFRLSPQVPLIIPEVNGSELREGASTGIISTPNCVAVPLCMTLKALSSLAEIKRVVVSTYQSVSGAGKAAIDELYNQTKSYIMASECTHSVFPKQIAFNVIPMVGDIDADGITDEEEKISAETCKILNSNIATAVTCVRVPVFVGHAMSVNCEFNAPFDINQVYDAFEDFEGIVTIDRRDREDGFATPIDAQGEDGVYVSRIRKDLTLPNGLLYWVTADNLRKGAALNSVQIAELMISIDPTLQIFKAKQAC